MPYEDWTPEFQEMWNELPVDFSDLTPGQYEYAEYMFEEGFMHYAGEQGPADTSFAREEFFYELGIDYEEFDWAGWREALYGELPCPVRAEVAPARKPLPVTVKLHGSGQRLSVLLGLFQSTKYTLKNVVNTDMKIGSESTKPNVSDMTTGLNDLLNGPSSSGTARAEESLSDMSIRRPKKSTVISSLVVAGNLILLLSVVTFLLWIVWTIYSILNAVILTLFMLGLLSATT